MRPAILFTTWRNEKRETTIDSNFSIKMRETQKGTADMAVPAYSNGYAVRLTLFRIKLTIKTRIMAPMSAGRM